MLLVIKKIGNFTQTYCGTPEWSPGSDFKNRDFLINAFCKDINKIKCFNLLDIQTFSFHNFELQHAKTLNKKLKNVLPNILSFCYNNMTFAECIYKHLLFLKSKGITDVLWVQDDEFFTSTNFKDFKAFIDFYKTEHSITNVNLLMPKNDNAFNKTTCTQILKIPNTNLNLYGYNTKDLSKHTQYTMNFTAFICNIDYFLKKMFDINFLALKDVYQLEYNIALKATYNNVKRYCFDTGFFESFNIVGMLGSLGDSEKQKLKLEKLFDI